MPKKRHLYICSGRQDRDHCNGVCPHGRPHYIDECTKESWCAIVKDFVRCKPAGQRAIKKFEEALNVRFDI
ncbi:MAG: hypothetical protein GY753_11880 [Gammaproteobacteria bacterium]|nr:hypothetical protein [Gammaproteobacteria bacterium]